MKNLTLVVAIAAALMACAKSPSVDLTPSQWNRVGKAAAAR